MISTSALLYEDKSYVERGYPRGGFSKARLGYFVLYPLWKVMKALNMLRYEKSKFWFLFGKNMGFVHIQRMVKNQKV